MKVFLHLKAFVVFLLTSGLLIALVAIILILALIDSPWSDRLDSLVSFVGAFTVICTQLWVYALANGLQEKIPHELRDDLQRFNGIFGVACVAAAAEFIADELVDPDFGGRRPMFLYVLQLVKIVASISNFLFVSRQLKTIESQRQATFGDYYGYFFGFLFHFIGVFWIQPRVNRVFSGEAAVDPNRPLDQI